MKITIEKEEFQLLGQVVLEALHSNDRRVANLYYVVLIEWYQDNIEAFTFPQRRKRKLRLSQTQAIATIVHCCLPIGRDPLWDATLIGLREKFRIEKAQTYPQIGCER